MQSLLTLLLVDASGQDRGLLKTLLSRDATTTYSFMEAERVEAAVQLGRRTRPDAVLLAYPWSGGSGGPGVALAALKEVGGTVLILTTLDREAQALEIARTAADGCLLKGQLSTANLAFAVHHAVQQARLVQRLETQRSDLQRTIDVLQEEQRYLTRQQQKQSRELLRLNKELQEEVGRSARAGSERHELRLALAQSKQRKLYFQKAYYDVLLHLRKEVRLPLQALLGELDLQLQEAGVDPVDADRILRPGQQVLDCLDAGIEPPDPEGDGLASAPSAPDLAEPVVPAPPEAAPSERKIRLTLNLDGEMPT